MTDDNHKVTLDALRYALIEAQPIAYTDRLEELFKQVLSERDQAEDRAYERAAKVADKFTSPGMLPVVVHWATKIREAIRALKGDERSRRP